MANNTEMQYLQINDMNAKEHMPLIRVSFHTKTKCYHTYGKEVNKFNEKLDPNYQVLQVSTQKSLSSPAGSFTVTLAGTQWMTYLTTNDVVVIQMGYAGEKLTTVMVGLIDKINRRRTIGSDGKPSVNTSITGRDFGKLFVRDILKFYPEINGASQGSSNYFLTDVGWVNLIKVFTTDNIMKGTPATIIDNIMRYIFMKFHDTQWTVYEEHGSNMRKRVVTAGEIVRYTLGKIDFFLPFIFTADQFEGAIWNLLERASIKPFTELFIDVRDESESWNPSPNGRGVPHDIEQKSSIDKSKLPKDNGFYPYPSMQFGEDGAKVTMILRETPFDSVYRKRLVAHVIKQEDVITEDLSKSDEEHYNLFWAGTTVNPLGIDLKRVCPPLFNEKDAKRYGLSPLEVNIEGLEILQEKANEQTKTLEGLTQTYTAKLKAWFEKNHEYLNGTLEFRGNPKVRIGHRLLYPYSELKKEFYVEAVMQSFNVFEGFTTGATVTRGMNLDEDIDFNKYLPKPPAKPPATPPPPSTTKDTPKEEYHTVVDGETLWSIAGDAYKDSTKWRKIWDANRDMLIKRDPRNASDNGHWIYPGQKLRIPK